MPCGQRAHVELVYSIQVKFPGRADQALVIRYAFKMYSFKTSTHAQFKTLLRKLLIEIYFQWISK